MTRTTHTPAPWQRFDNGGEMSPGLAYGSAYADCVWGPEGPGHGLIADCSPNSQAPTAESIANAKLIAAAPELLSALRNAVSLLKSLPGTPWPESIFDAVMEAKRAIAKAEGRA